jgi:hypothetical protein
MNKMSGSILGVVFGPRTTICEGGTYIHTYMHTYIRITYVHTYIHTYIRTYVHTCYIHTSGDVHTCTRERTRAHTHTQRGGYLLLVPEF